MSSRTIRLSEEHWDTIDMIADQLDTSRKAVVDMILEWFFSMPSAGPLEAFEELYEVEDEDEEEVEEDEEEE